MAYPLPPLMTPMAQMPAPALCTNQHSTLHQERLYLLSALAKEEDRGERLTRAFEALNLKLKKVESADPPESPRKLKQSIKGIRNKIGQCQHRERALADNLAQVVAHMEGLKRYQWRTAQHNYAQQHQHGQMMVMSPGFPPGFALQSPMNMDLVPDMQYLALEQPLTARLHQQYQQPCPAMDAYHPTYVNPQMPPTPIIIPQTQYASPVESSSIYGGSPAETYTGSEIEELAVAISPCDLSALGINGLPRRRTSTVNSNPFADQQESTITVAKMPDPTAAAAPMSPASAKPGEMTRRLSTLDATSAGMRLDRKATQGQQSA